MYIPTCVTHNARVFRMPAIMRPIPGVYASTQSLLRSNALHLVHNYLSVTLTIDAIFDSSQGAIFKSKLPADDVGVFNGPAVIADCAPAVPVQNLYSSRLPGFPANQAYVMRH